MVVKGLPAFKDNYIWSIIDTDNQLMFCVDPGDAEPVLTYCDTHQLSLGAILITHHHYDHIGGLHVLKKTYPNVVIYGPDDDRIPLITHPVYQKDLVSFAGLQFEIIDIPGHTKTHIGYYEPICHWLFCGDTLFSAGCGRIFEGTPEQLYQSLSKLKNLPNETLIYCAHEYTYQNLQFALTIEPNNEEIQKYIKKIQQTPENCTIPSSMEKEKKINPFLRTDTQSVRLWASKKNISPQDSIKVFAKLRQEKDSF